VSAEPVPEWEVEWQRRIAERQREAEAIRDRRNADLAASLACSMRAEVVRATTAAECGKVPRAGRDRHAGLSGADARSRRVTLLRIADAARELAVSETP